MYVELFETKWEGQESVGKIILKEGKIQFENMSEGMIEFLEEGFLFHNKMYYPKDKEKFLRILKYAITGTYLRASGVKE